MNFELVRQAIDYINTCNSVERACSLEDFDDVFAPHGVTLRQILELFCGLHTDPETNLLTFQKICRKNLFAESPEEALKKLFGKFSDVSQSDISMSGMSMSVTSAEDTTSRTNHNSMTRQDQQSAFSSELDRLVERFRQEFDLTYADIAGVLTLKLHCMCQEAYEYEDEEN